MNEHVSASRHEWSSDRLLTPCTRDFRQAGLVNDATSERLAHLFISGSIAFMSCFSSLALPLPGLVTCMEIWRPLRQTHLLSPVSKRE